LQARADFSVLRIPVKVGQLARIGLQIVEFIQPVGVILTHPLQSFMCSQHAHVGESGVVQIVLSEYFRAPVGIAQAKPEQREIPAVVLNLHRCLEF
jgi:hypothetical protein